MSNFKKEEIEDISYDYIELKMTIKLKVRKLINGFMTNEVFYNCDENTFKKSVTRWIDK